MKEKEKNYRNYAWIFFRIFSQRILGADTEGLKKSNFKQIIHKTLDLKNMRK